MKTVFVIGAGANVEIRMPSGNELKKIITEYLKPNKRYPNIKEDDLIDQAFNAYAEHYSKENDIDYSRALREIKTAAIELSRAMPLSESIDSYIERHKKSWAAVFCGKLVIVRAILNAEFHCAIPPIWNEHSSNELEEEKILFNSWYPLLFQKITEGCEIDELEKRFENISFIIFNYDRCFEYFMYRSLIFSTRDIDPEIAKKIVEKLHINHPYGTVGSLWNKNGDITFGKKPNRIDLINLALRIKTFSERTNMEGKKDGFQNFIREADRIIFLGFAYHKQNIDLLFDHLNNNDKTNNRILSKNIVYYGTGYGISKNDLKHLNYTLKSKDIRIKSDDNIDISPVSCSDFFHDFRHRLSFKE